LDKPDVLAWRFHRLIERGFGEDEFGCDSKGFANQPIWANSLNSEWKLCLVRPFSAQTIDAGAQERMHCQHILRRKMDGAARMSEQRQYLAG